MPRSYTLLALAMALALFAAGCTMQTKAPTNVTTTSATLHGQVGCAAEPYGPVWWELREAGQATWRLVGAEQSVSCPRGASQSEGIGISEPVSGLRPDTSYEFRVGVNPPSGSGSPLYSPARSFSTAGSRRPVVVPASGREPATLRVGSVSGSRLELKGVNVWGLQDPVTTSFGASQYANRAQVVRTIKSWGANIVRFRVLADDYNSSANKAQIIQRIKDWRDAVVGQGMYFMPCSWDALDGAHSDAGWAGNGARVHQLFADIRAALGNDPMVIYEVTNEPNNVTWDAWNANMQSSISYFRETLGYRGLLVIDPIWWANSGGGGQGYDDGRYSALEAYDAARPGMGAHQLAFAKHDYANNYPGKAWNAGAWVAAQGGSQTKHLIFETEFGNYNGDTSTVSASWAAAAASFFAGRFAAQPNYVGAAAFLFGPWFDANGLTGADNATPTAWGAVVRDKFF
jgi:Cellulase (glycosyl hydrolase family 5)